MTRSDWIDNEYETFITSRRDGVFERAVVCKRRPPNNNTISNSSSLAVLDLTMAAAAAGGGGKAASGLGVAADIRDSGMSVQQQLLQQQKFEDMDVALPLHWESMMRASRRRRACYNNAAAAAPPKLQELDNRNNNNNNNNNGMMMIHRRGGGGGGQEVLEQQECRAAAASCCKEQKSCSHPQQQQESFVVSRRMVTEPFSKMSPVTLARMFEPKYSKFCVNSTDFAPVELVTGGGLADSRSSSFRSQSSCSVILWGESSTPGEYGGRGDCCMTSSSSVDQSSSSSSATSSRDSNGSSQDAYFDNCSTRLSTDSGQPPRSSHVDVSAAAAATPAACAAVGAAAIKSCKDARPEAAAAAAGVLPSDVETAAFGAHGFMESERPAACRSWLRSPFKWKVPTFGGKSKMTTKAAAAAESSMDTHDHAKVQHEQEQQQKLQRPQRQRNVAGRISDMSYMDHAAAVSKLQRTAAAAAPRHHHHHPCTDCCLVDAAAPRSAVAPPRHSYSHESSSSSAAATSSCKVLPGASRGAAAGSFSSPPPAREFVMRRSSECYNDKAASSSPAAECAPQLRRRSVSSTHHAAAGHFDRGCSSSSRSDNYVQQQAAGGEREHRVEKAAAADTGSLSKARERWLKCMKLLKLPYGRSATERLAAAATTGPPAAAAPSPHQSSSSVCKMQDQLLQHRPSCSSTPGTAATPLTRISISSSSDNNNAMRARPSFDEKLMRPARPPSVDANKPMRSKSMPAAFDRTAPSSSSSLSSSRPKSHVVSAAPGLAGCGSLSSHSPRFPASNNNVAVCENNTRSSSKMSMNQLPAVQMNNRASAAAAASAGGGVASSSPRVKSSPKFSCRRSVSPNIRNNHSPKIINSATPASIMNNNSQMSELHSAVQGAIAHCKRSHTSTTTSSSQHQSQTTPS
ncbi:unnamed protein product [Sphagnum troendelagicum]|uniref:Uncharacterized protein n=1 Tax=Sphagnum troendelagicum TaxID=128251 RepID=A0ABP0TPN1_9BRYO